MASGLILSVRSLNDTINGWVPALGQAAGQRRRIRATTMSLDAIDERTKLYVSGAIAACFDGAKHEVVTATALEDDLVNKYNLGFLKKCAGKVRDMYICKDVVIMVATDRQSAFDRQLTSVPFKGQVLNLTSLWWFHNTAHIAPNHIIASPHPNVTIGKKCVVFPIEFVMRGYITGTTSTSMWTNYNKGVRNYCGHILQEGLVKNQKLDVNMLTPTTKDEHDELISAEEIVSSGRMSKEDWDICANYAEKLFAYSQSKAKEAGLILVDTKYEFGKDISGEIVLIDEVQTPDSSRYWIEASYQSRFDANLEPENIDKEFLRKWYVSNCDPYKDATLPEAPRELVLELSRRYIMIYELLTMNKFDFDNSKTISEALDDYFS